MPTDKCLIKMNINKEFLELCWKARGPLPAQQNENVAIMWEVNAQNPGVFELPGTTKTSRKCGKCFFWYYQKRGVPGWQQLLTPSPYLVHRAEEDEWVQTDPYRLSFIWVFPPFSLRQTWSCRQVVLCGVASLLGCWALKTHHLAGRSQATDFGGHHPNPSFKHEPHHKSLHWSAWASTLSELIQVFQAWLVSVSPLRSDIWKSPFGQFLSVSCFLRRRIALVNEHWLRWLDS